MPEPASVCDSAVPKTCPEFIEGRNVPDLVWQVSQNYQEYTSMNENGKRYIGLDVHKHYLIALGVNEALEVVMPARRVELMHLETWMQKTLTKQDEVVLEMTTNTWQLYDELVHLGINGTLE